MKSSIYSKPDYAVTYGKDDVLFLDIVLEILEENPSNPTYSVKIRRCQLATSQEYLCEILMRLVMSGHPLGTLLAEELHSLLLKDVTPILRSLFYAGDLQNHE